jgi:hypothetical protein
MLESLASRLRDPEFDARTFEGPWALVMNPHDLTEMACNEGFHLTGHPDPTKPAVEFHGVDVFEDDEQPEGTSSWMPRKLYIQILRDRQEKEEEDGSVGGSL